MSDSLFPLQDSIAPMSAFDSVALPPPSSVLEGRVDYKAKDSIVFDLQTKHVSMYGESEMEYQKMKIESGKIELGFDSKELSAEGIENAKGEKSELPRISEGNSSYRSHQLKFNMQTKKGIIRKVITQEGEGFLHGETIKKQDEKVMFIAGGKFTTCEEEHPHFSINFSKAKAVAGEKIITGLAWLTIGDIPIYFVGFPFGYFPFTSSRTSGLVFPSYGYAENRGYSLQHLGWYFAFNDYIDLLLLSDIYTNSSWAINAKSQYAKRYRYRGMVEVRNEHNKTGITQTPTRREEQSLKLRWEHQQDGKANPNSSFSASVNLVTASYAENTNNVNDYFQNTTTSSISYSSKIGQKFNFTANLGETYNVNTRVVDLKLPSVVLSSSVVYPLRRKKVIGDLRWYEKISVSYRSNLTNTIKTPDSLLFEQDIHKRMKNGVQHTIPIQNSQQIFKFFTWTNNINYTARWYLSESMKQWNAATNKIDKDTIYRFVTNRDMRVSTALSTRIYGMFLFKKGKVKAVRHVLSPSVSFVYHPDFADPVFGYYHAYIDKKGEKQYYSRTEDGIFGSPPKGKSGQINVSLGNNLEMKIRSAKDTINQERKIMLIESFSIVGGYDFAKDSLQWKPLQIDARTTIFRRLQVNFSSSFTPYVVDSVGRMRNEYLWDKERRFLKRENSRWNLNLSWEFNSNKEDKRDYNPAVIAPAEMKYSPFVFPQELMSPVDFNATWGVRMDFTYSNLSSWIAREAKYETNEAITLSVAADITLSPKWKIGIHTGYDLFNKDFTFTSIDFYRDLHCWDMRMNWIPFGPRMSWNFTIGVKASMLQDLKYEKKNDFRNRRTYD